MSCCLPPPANYPQLEVHHSALLSKYLSLKWMLSPQRVVPFITLSLSLSLFKNVPLSLSTLLFGTDTTPRTTPPNHSEPIVIIASLILFISSFMTLPHHHKYHWLSPIILLHIITAFHSMLSSFNFPNTINPSSIPHHHSSLYSTILISKLLPLSPVPKFNMGVQTPWTLTQSPLTANPPNRVIFLPLVFTSMDMTCSIRCGVQFLIQICFEVPVRYSPWMYGWCPLRGWIIICTAGLLVANWNRWEGVPDGEVGDCWR